MKRGVILLEEASAASSATSSRRDGDIISWSRMIDFSSSAPGGILFAVYFSPGGGGDGGLFSSCSSQGLVTTPASFPGSLESGVCSFSANFGLEVCWLEQAWATAIQSAKATGYVLLLGVGGLLCYKFYRAHRARCDAGLPTYIFPMSFTTEMTDAGEIWDEMEEDLFDFLEVDLSVGLNCLSGDHRPKRKVGIGVYRADRIRTRWRHVTGRHKTAQELVAFQPLPLRRHYSTPEGLVRLSHLHKTTSAAQEDDSRLFVHFSADDRSDSLSGLSSLEASPNHVSNRLRSYSLSVKDPRFQGEVEPWNQWDGSIDSINVSEVSRLIRDCSVDSDGSDFSLDMSLNERCGLSTLQVIERIEQEINNVKDNCLAMNQELYTLHDVRIDNDTPSSADTAPEAELGKLQLSRSSFMGILNLTAIPDELSDSASNISDSSPSHKYLLQHFNGDEDPFCMEWDDEDLPASKERCCKEADQLVHVLPSPSTSALLPLSKSSSLLQVESKPVWCSQESGYLEWEGTTGSSSSNEASATTSLLSPLLEKREKDSMSCTTSYSSCLNSPDDSSFQDQKDQSDSSESGLVKRRQWVQASQHNRDSAIFDLGLDLEAAWREEAVGLTVQLHSYANDTWQAPTSRAHAIKQAYIEMERMTDCRRMRRMRGDHYGILRASLCQMVMKKLPLPSSSAAIANIARDLDQGNDWIRSWTFGHRLPYGPDNVLQGMCHCLETLDRLVDELTDESDPLESLVDRLNADVLLDTRLMEALKLHVLSAALSLELAESLGETLPLFALALFARPDSKTTKQLIANYLNPIGDSATLERAEFYLLSYSLGVRVDVYRPTAISVDGDDNLDLRTSYPDWESYNSFISIIEEDERHYSVPVP